MERRRRLLIMRGMLILKQAQMTRRSTWVRPVWSKRKVESEYYTAMQVMRDDPEYFFKFYRMTPEVFDNLHCLVAEKLTKQSAVREPITSGERLAMTLRYLSSGDAIMDIAMAFRVGLETAREAIHLTCQVLWDELAPRYMKAPTEPEWAQIADGFWKRWQFPNCLGAVDGKHVQIEAPPNSGSLYYNYKGTFSIVLMAVADSRYLFRLIDVGAPGRTSDGGVFKRSPIGQRLEAGLLEVPPCSRLPGSEKVLPHSFIGDEAFQLRPDFMRPYPGSRDEPAERVFNYRLSRARRCVENAFGILTARFRIFRGPIKLKPENAERVVKAACVLHNFLCLEARGRSMYCPVGFADYEDAFGNVVEGAWRKDAAASTCTFNLRATHARKGGQTAQGVRSVYAQFFVKEGSVPWQWDLLEIKEPDTQQPVHEAGGN